MARASGYPLANRALDGELGALLKQWTEEGMSYFDMAYKLRSEHDLHVSPSTVSRWIKQAESEPSEVVG